MKVNIRKAPYLLFLFVFLLLSYFYQILNERPQDAIDISTLLDQSIPFVPIFIIPYIIWNGYIFGYLVYFCFKDTKVYIKTLVLIFVGEMLCYIIYFFFPTTVPRPIITSNSMLNQIVNWIYMNDQPVNCFPSIHVLTTFSIMLASLHIKNKHVVNMICVHVLGSLIIVSTLFVKQHVIMDMIGSMFLVTFLYGITFEILSFRVRGKSEPIYVKNKS